MEIKITEIELIVNKELNNICLNENVHFKCSEEIRKNTLDQLYHLISKWNGVDLSRTKAPLTRYRDYFCVAMNWWDQTKRSYSVLYSG